MTAGGPAIRVGGEFHFWIGSKETDLSTDWGRSVEERHRCTCHPGGMGRCMLRATQEDALCDACRATSGHGGTS